MASLGASDAVGLATLMLSYSWSNSLGDIIGVLEEHCRVRQLDPAKCFVWIDCLCINQHRLAAVDVIAHEVLVMTFGTQLARIGNVLVLMSPWTNPLYLTRVWVRTSAPLPPPPSRSPLHSMILLDSLARALRRRPFRLQQCTNRMVSSLTWRLCSTTVHVRDVHRAPRRLDRNVHPDAAG